MTTQRDIPFQADTLAWVHNELAEIKSRLAIAQQAAEQSRSLATDASEKALQSRTRIDQFDGVPAALAHLQDDLRSTREQLVRAQDDIHTLHQAQEETERRIFNDAERVRQDRNEVGRAFGEIERAIGGWQERVTSFEEHNRRNLEIAAQLMQRLELIEAQQQEGETLHSRVQTQANRTAEEVQRLASALGGLAREDDVQRERVTSAIEMQRRLEVEIEAVKRETGRLSRIDDRLELVQAERTRHNERLNDLTGELGKVEGRLNEHQERMTLAEVRTAGYQEEMRALKERLELDRETIAGYLHSLAELEADMRKRQIIALEKEIRDVRSRALNFGEE